MSPGFVSIPPSHSSPGPAVIFGGIGCLGPAHSKPSHPAKPLWQHSPPAGPHLTTPASPSSPCLLTFPLAGNDCHLENIFPPTWFQRGLQTERQELSRDCSALWGEASRRLQGALQPRSPTHQHCCGIGLIPARGLALGTDSCMQSTNFGWNFGSQPQPDQKAPGMSGCWCPQAALHPSVVGARWAEAAQGPPVP